MLRRAVLLLVGVAGCLNDTPPSASGGSTEGPTCTRGEVLCPCRSYGTCDAGLACVPEGCIPDACDPGTPMCTCLQPGDVCAAGWTCVDGLCHEIGATTTDGMTTMSSLSDASSGAVTSTTQPGTSESSVGTTFGSDSVSVGTTSPICADAPTCFDCGVCASDNHCVDEYTACMADNIGCMEPLMCIYLCPTEDMETWQACIAKCGCGGNNMALASLIDCFDVVCDTACALPLPCGTQA